MQLHEEQVQRVKVGEPREAGLKMLQKTSDGLKLGLIELEDISGVMIQPWAKIQKVIAKRIPAAAA